MFMMDLLSPQIWQYSKGFFYKLLKKQRLLKGSILLRNFIGDGIRGATWVALHNGGGVGWGEGNIIKNNFK